MASALATGSENWRTIIEPSSLVVALVSVGGVVSALHHDVEYVADQPAVAVVGGHFYRNRLHIRSRRRALEGPRGGVEAQPGGQIRVVTLRRRVDQRVAAVGVGERGVREGVAEQRALRRCLVRDRDRDHRDVVGGGGGQHRPDRRVGVAGKRAIVKAPEIFEDHHLHLDRLALVGGNQRVGEGCRARNVGLVAAVNPDPLDGGGGVVHRKEESIIQSVHIRNVARRRRQHLAHLRRARDPRLARRRVVHRPHNDAHRIRRRTVVRAVVHPEGECNPTDAVRHGGVFQVAGGELGRGHRLRQVPRCNRRARKRERARCR